MHNCKPSPIKLFKTTSKFQRLLGKVILSNFAVREHDGHTNWQTSKKTPQFCPPPSGSVQAKSKPPKLGMVMRSSSTFLHLKNVLGYDAQFCCYGVLKIWRQLDPLKFRPPLLWNPLTESPQILIHDPAYSALHNPEKFHKICAMYTPVWGTYVQIFGKNFIKIA